MRSSYQSQVSLSRSFVSIAWQDAQNLLIAHCGQGSKAISQKPSLITMKAMTMSLDQHKSSLDVKTTSQITPFTPARQRDVSLAPSFTQYAMNAVLT
jgi:hypothetical protein